MALSALLWSFEGRIGRRTYWLTSFATIIAIIALVGLISVVAGAEVLTGDFAGNVGAGLLILVLSIPLVWIGLALGAKRLHDRDKSAWWLLVFYVLPGGLENAADFAGSMRFALALASIALSIWALVELGFLSGTSGSNRYGPDPLARA